jgi:hypothetical protein
VVDTVPARLVSRWEEAYRQYGVAFDHAARMEAGDRQAAEAVAAASWQVAGLWRDMATAVPLSWWLLAALRAAADAFEAQARSWHAKAAQPEPPRPARRVAARPAGQS